MEPEEDLSDVISGDISTPALTLIFTTDDPVHVGWDRLLQLSEAAIQAINLREPRLHILKAFTFYAGEGDHASDS